MNDTLSRLNFLGNFNNSDSLFTVSKNYQKSMKRTTLGKIESVYYSNSDTLYFIGSNVYPQNIFYEQRWDTLLTPVFSLFKYYQNSLTEVLPIFDLGTNDSNFYFIPNNFFVKDNIIFMRVYQSSQIKEKIDYEKAFFIGKWKYSDLVNGLKFKEFESLKLPEFHQQKNLGYNLFDFIYKEPYLGTIVTCDIYNIENKIHLRPPIITGISEINKDKGAIKVRIDFMMTDFIERNRIMKIMYKKGKHFFICTLDLNQNRIIEDLMLLNKDLSENNYVESPKFKNENEIYYFTKESRLKIYKIN